MTLNPKPLATVLIPTYNYATFVSEAIESVLGQTFPQDDIEIIVIDDGSEDDTREVVSKYADRVQYVYQENSGSAAAMNVGINAARGKYIFRLDADDVFLPEKIEKIVNIFESDSAIVHVGTPVIYWDMSKGSKITERVPDEIKGRKINGRELLVYFCRKIGNIIGGGSSFSARADVLKKTHIAEEINYSSDEYLLLATLRSGFSFYTEMPLSLYRLHGKNYSRASKARVKNEMIEAKAILSEILSDGFPAEVAVTYGLKARITRLKYKEVIGEDTFSEVVDMWKFISANRHVLGRDTLKVIWKYWVLNRTLLSVAPKFMRERL